MTQTLDAPARKSTVQYVTTADGYHIAYTVTGQGEPFLMAPCLLQNDIQRSTCAQDFINGLEQGFRVIQYDGRGTGQSTRGVKENTTLTDLLEDLLAVVNQLRLDRFVLYGDVFASYLLLLAAAELKKAVKAVVLVNPAPVNGAPFMPQWESMYTSFWESFTNTFVLTYVSESGSGKDMREVVNHEDFVRLARSARGFHLEDVLSRVDTPTLVLANRNPLNPALMQTAQQIASTIPESLLVLFDGQRVADILSAPNGGLPPALPVIEDFLAGLSDINRAHDVEARSNGHAGLSRRELAVLRLIAVGRSNQQIADELVISLNTVKRHVANIFDKTGVANRAEAATYAHHNQLA